MQETEKKAGKPHSERLIHVIILTMGMAMVIYQFIAIFLSPFDPLTHINIHLTFAFILVFSSELLKSIKRGVTLSSIIIFCLLVSSLVSTGYVFVLSEELQMRSGLATVPDLIIGVAIIVVVFEAVRRSTGLALPLFGLFFLAYAFFGQHLPQPFYHPAVKFSRMISWLSISVTTGVYSNLLDISANVVFFFVMFASVLEITKAREFFNLIGILIGRRMRGGTAQAAVISSGLVGSITGGAVVNVIITGAATIPAMKKSGYRAEFAGAVESVASCGGMLMPPIMGATAFMMVALTGLTYLQVCIAAIIPALLYYLSAGFSVFVHAGKSRIPKSTEEVDLRLLLRRSPLFLGPFVTLIILLARQYSPAFSGGVALIIGLILGFLRRETRPSLGRFVEGMAEGAKTASAIAVMLAMGGVFVSVMSVTALGPKVVQAVGAWSAGHLPLILLFTMMASLLLGCAVPMSGGYLIVALLVTPILLRSGVSVMQAHFFALFFSVIGFLTPPVAPAALVASSISKGSFIKTALHAIRIAAVGYLIPFMFVYDPALLGRFEGGITQGILSVMSAMIVVVSLAVMLYHYFLTKMSIWEMIFAALSLIGNLAYFFTKGNRLAVYFGISCFLLILIIQIRKVRRENSLDREIAVV